ncbi:MAG: peptidase M23 [Bacteroidetes bacterium]|nr:MAG: peptidase M23 [Bacteroidota bacterium]PTM14269.1 MAG: peptidase M23 [Bacteroidota bacterium]
MDLYKVPTRLYANILRRKGLLIGFAVLTTAIITFGFYTKKQQQHDQSDVELAAFPVIVPNMAWGFALDTLQLVHKTIDEGQSLSDILAALGIGSEKMQSLILQAGQVFDLRGMRAGKPLILLSKDSIQGIDYLVYEPSVYEYIVFDLHRDQSVQKFVRPVTSKVETAAGIIEGSLWNAMVDRGYSYELTAKMEQALKWSIDFHHLQKDDEFRLVYEQDYVEGKPVAVGNVIAAQYTTADTVFHSIYFDNGAQRKETGYYDLAGKPMNAGFLKAPVEYARISSYYSLNRLHPVLKYRRPHYGTDYAAPYGTPIVAVGNGTVSNASYTGGNGNYVKIRHNETYETQYLHMQKIATGIRPGVAVHQGQVIGYVGSTGLATGPHVCFRFWKNGQQVNHLKMDLPPAKPLPDSLMGKFAAIRDFYVPQLQGIHPVALNHATTTTDATATPPGQALKIDNP